MPNIKTSDGRGRAWIALALMEKRLHVYLSSMVKNPAFLKTYYSGESMWLIQEDSMRLILMVSWLKDVNFNLFLKEADQNPRIKATQTPYGFNASNPVELKGNEITAQCSNCFQHTKHTQALKQDTRIYKCERCTKATVPWFDSLILLVR